MKLFLFLAIFSTLLASHGYAQEMIVENSTRTLQVTSVGQERDRFIGRYILGFLPLQNEKKQEIASISGISNPFAPPSLWIAQYNADFAFDSKESASKAIELFRRCASLEYPVTVTIDLYSGKVTRLFASSCLH